MARRDALGGPGATAALPPMRRGFEAGRRAAAVVGPRHAQAPVCGAASFRRGSRQADHCGASVSLSALQAHLYGGAPGRLSGPDLSRRRDRLGACLLGSVCRHALGRRRQRPAHSIQKVTSPACPARLGAAETLGQSRRSRRRTGSQGPSRAHRRHLCGPKPSVDSPLEPGQTSLSGGDKAAFMRSKSPAQAAMSDPPSGIDDTRPISLHSLVHAAIRRRICD